jgi:hypothetical protein
MTLRKLLISVLALALALPALARNRDDDGAAPVARRSSTPLRTAFEASGSSKVWLLAGHGLLRVDLKDSVKLSEPAYDLLLLDSGKLLVATDRCVGILDADHADLKKGLVPVKELLLLPSRGFRLAPAGPGRALAYGYDLYGKQFICYLVGGEGEPKPIYRSSQSADAALVHDGLLYLAQGQGIVALPLDGGKAQPVARLSAPAAQLAWAEGFGLAVASPAGLMLVKEHGRLLRLAGCKDCQVRGHEGALYVMTPSPFSVLRLRDIPKKEVE